MKKKANAKGKPKVPAKVKAAVEKMASDHVAASGMKGFAAAKAAKRGPKAKSRPKGMKGG